MIQVIEHKPIKEYEIRCPLCESLLRFDSTDEIIDKYDDLYINCPVCGYQIYTYHPNYEKELIRYISTPKKEGE